MNQVSVNVGQNMSPFSVLYKQRTISRNGSGYAVKDFGGRKVLRCFGTPSKARAYIDSLGELSPATGGHIALGLVLMVAVGHYLTRSK